MQLILHARLKLKRCLFVYVIKLIGKLFHNPVLSSRRCRSESIQKSIKGLINLEMTIDRLIENLKRFCSLKWNEFLNFLRLAPCRIMEGGVARSRSRADVSDLRHV